MTAIYKTVMATEEEKVNKCSVLQHDENNNETIVTNEAIATEVNQDTSDIVNKKRRRPEAEELLRYLYSVMDKMRYENQKVSVHNLDEESDNDNIECDDYYSEFETSYHLVGHKRSEHKRNRPPSKEQKFTKFCRTRQTPENIRLEKGKKDEVRVQYSKCVRQMSRDANRREHNERRKANIERKFVKLGVKRRGWPVEKSNEERTEVFYDHELRAGNVPEEMKSMLNFLMALQTREVTPNDYELLLQLDDLVPNKTISKQRLRRLQEEAVDSSHVEELCGICMENYQIGELRKILPCNHAFHRNCIDQWLGQSSTKCPLDGREI